MVELSLSASLVVYKPDLFVLERTLLSLQRAAQNARNHYSIGFDLVLVDNSCNVIWHERLHAWVKQHADEWPDCAVGVLKAPGNIGYGHGNNLVIEQTQSDYHIVINPDLFVEQDALSQAIRFMQSNLDVGLLTPAVVGENGERQYLCKRNPTLFIMFLRGFAPMWLRSCFQAKLNAFEMRECNYDEEIDGVAFPTGCFMLFRTACLHELGGFDDRFFMYFEDADIGRRMLPIARVVYVPTVKAVHLWARDSQRNWRMRWVFIWSALIYWKKWGGAF